MRTVFIHGEVDLFATAKEELVERFTTWCAEEGAEPPLPLVELLLDTKFARDGLLAHWTEADLRRFLTEVAPRRLAWGSGWSAVPEFLHRWLDFLAETGLLMTGPAPELHAAVEAATPAFLSGMAEPSEWSGSKFWTVTMREHGVDSEDQQAVDTFFDAVAEDQVVIDDSLADTIEDRDVTESSEEFAFWLPPTGTSDAESSLSAEDSDIVVTMRAVVEWARSGRALDAEGVPSESDVDELLGTIGGDRSRTELLLEWAKQAGLVRVAGGRLVPSLISTGLLEQSSLLWARLWQSFVLLDALDTDVLGEDALPKLIQEALNALYSHPDAVPLELITDLAVVSLDADDEEDPRPWVGQMLHRILELWESMGVVHLFSTDDPEQTATIDAAIPEGATPDYTLVELLPAGLDAARGSLEAFGFTAPTADDLVEYPAEVVTLALGSGSEDVVEAASHAWVSHRGAPQASAELATLLRRVDDPVVRLMALGLLEYTGTDGVGEVLELIDDPAVGSAARIWLQERTADEVAVRPDDELVFSLDAMSVAAGEDAELFLAEFQRQSTPEQIAVIDQIPSVRHSRADAVLEAIAGHHPDDEIASAAQRSLDKVRAA